LLLPRTAGFTLHNLISHGFFLGFIRLYRSALSRRAARADISVSHLQQPDFPENRSREPDD
jgi:hypothetical protein